MIRSTMQPLFRDVTDHVKTIQEQIDSIREVLAFAFEANLLVGQAQETAVSKKLASWLAIIAVPTAIARNLRHELQKYARAAMGIRILHCDDMYLSYKCFLILAFAPRRMAVSCVAARPSVCTENPVARWDLWTYRGVSSLGSDATSRTAASASLTRSSKLRSHSIDGDSTSSPFVLALQNGCWTARLKCGWGDGVRPEPLEERRKRLSRLLSRRPR